MIITVTLNPAVDNIIKVNEFIPGKMNRVIDEYSILGGKGINISRILGMMGEKSIITGFLGEKDEGTLEKFVAEYGLINEFILIDGKTRVNMKIIDNRGVNSTEINRSGPEINKEDVNRLKQKIQSIVHENDIVIFSGSVPPNLENTIYYDLINLVKNNDAKAILDAEGELLKEGIRAFPFLIKPNLDEMMGIVPELAFSLENYYNWGKNLIQKGVQNILISMADQGALFINDVCAHKVSALNIIPINTVGAGDALLAAYILALENDESIHDSLKFATACAIAVISTKYSSQNLLFSILGFENKISVEEFCV